MQQCFVSLDIIIPLAFINILTVIFGIFLHKFIMSFKLNSKRRHKKRKGKVIVDMNIDEVSIDDSQITTKSVVDTRNKLSCGEDQMEAIAESMINMSNQIKQNIESMGDIPDDKKEMLKLLDNFPKIFTKIIDSTEEEIEEMMKNMPELTFQGDQILPIGQKETLLTLEQEEKILSETLDSLH